MQSATLAYYRLLRGLVSGKRILDLRAEQSLGASLLREAGNRVDLEHDSLYDLVLALDNFGATEDVRLTLNRLRCQLMDGGVFAVSSRIAPTTGVVDASSPEVAFRFESLAKLLQDYFRTVTYAFLHGDELRAEWDQYSGHAIFFCRFLKPTALPETGPFLEQLDSIYGGTIKGLLPFSLPYLKAWLNQDSIVARPSPKGSLLFFLQPLPLYGDPLLYQTFFERYHLLGEQYRELGWDVSYSTTSELKSLYGAEHTLTPEDYRHSPYIRDWAAVYAKTLDPHVPLDNSDIAYWADYINFVLDQTHPSAVFVWNKNALLDRIAAARGILVIHNEVSLDRKPRPATYFFDPQGVNAESSLRDLWGKFRDFPLPASAAELEETYRRSYIEPWLGDGSRTELLHALALDPAKQTILIPLQVENDSNVLLNSPFASMSQFCEQVLDALPHSKYNVIIKPHPADPQGTHLDSSIAARARILPGGHPTGPLLRACDVVFTISSTMGYEALFAGKPVVTFGRSVYSHLGFTFDLESTAQLSEWELPRRAPQPELLDKFLFLASFYYSVSERFVSSAKEQEPVLLSWIQSKRAGLPAAGYWPEPGSVDWDRFCFAKLSEWISAPRTFSAAAPPALVPSETLRASLTSLETEHDKLLAVAEEWGTELQRERERTQLLESSVQKNESHLSELQVENEKLASQVQEEQGSAAALRTHLARVEKRVAAAYRTNEELEAAIQNLAAAEDRLRQTGESLAHSNAHLRKQLDSEAEKGQLIETELGAARSHSAALEDAIRGLRSRLEQSENRRTGKRLKRGLHGVLDIAQHLIPGPLRRLVRPLYLEQIYFRLYPEKRPIESPLNASRRNPAAVTTSSYPPYLDFKDRLYGSLPLDLRGITTPSARGLVSVVLPVYNGARYVAQSVESVLGQTYKNLELIIVDDGSTDATARILEPYRADPRVRIIRQLNQKLPAALNTGFAQATGEYRTWTSDDNVMLPDMLAELVAFLDQRQDTEMVYADQEVIDEDGEPLLNSDYCPGYQTPPGANLICWPRDPGELNFIQNNYFGGCFLYRAWAGVLTGGYSTSRFGYEDYDYWMRMNALFRVRHFGQRKPLYRYRLHWQSLSSRDGELQITERVRTFMAFETARRNFFAEPFDVTFFGAHPWFAQMAASYRTAGHNVFEGLEWNEKTRYHYDVTRAFPKSVAVFAESPPADALESARSRGAVIVQLTNGTGPVVECAIQLENAGERQQLQATSPKHLIYPILAGANSMSHRHERESSPMVNLQHA